MRFRSTDYNDDGLKLNLKLTCSTPMSAQPEAERVDFDYFEIVFTSECREAVLT